MKACILSVSGPELTEGERALLREQDPWALILMGRSCQSKPQVQALVDDIWNALERPCLIFIDQEGGRVARLKAPEWPTFPPAQAYGALYAKDKAYGLEACRLGHALMGHELSSLGIHADCAPVLDLPVDGAHDIIGDRAFAPTPEEAAELAQAAIDGLADAGVASVIKHIPGHGRARSDSHEELPVVDADLQTLQADFLAFRNVAAAPMAMTAHILYPAIDSANPATTSSNLIQTVIRDDIGFDGLLMSDDLGMKALQGSLAERAQASLSAGCDVVLHCSGFEKDPNVILAEMTEVAQAASELSGKALERAMAAEAVTTAPRNLDMDRVRHRFDLLMNTARGIM